MMKTVELTGVRELTVKEKPAPESVDGRPVIKVEASGICGSDIHYWDDGQPLGLVMGHEFSGTVSDPGSSKDLKVGDRVVCLSVAPCLECPDCLSGHTSACIHKGKAPGIIEASRPGAYAQYFSPLKEEYLLKLPDSMTFEEAALIEPATVGLHTARLGIDKMGKTVLVTGAGLIGAMTMQWCKKLGAKKVYFTEVNESRAKKILEMGYADVWLNGLEGYNELAAKFDESSENYGIQLGIAAQMLQIAGMPLGFDEVMDCSGHPSALNQGIALSKNYGSVVWAGVRSKPFALQHSLTIFRNINIKSFLGFDIPEYEMAMKSIADGSFPVKQYQSGSCTPETTQEAFVKLTTPGNDLFKIILYPQK
ncbi:MAG: alcohol dehydrogenase catalytic domain-containing protein [Ruminococcaceae bacterium]|nr:alcohol dehydrogenase catalytic domain-containing protein [Oscillospiraceae bacterium]